MTLTGNEIGELAGTSASAYDGKQFPSVEHAFQAQFVDEPHRDLFQVGSVCADHASGFEQLVPKSEVNKKVTYSKGKANIGILAKMIFKNDWLKNKEIEKSKAVNEDACSTMFRELLVKKFLEHDDLRNLLLETKDAYLLELDQSASRLESMGLRSRWSGMIVDGTVVGCNQMGALLMEVREELREMSALLCEETLEV